MGTGAASTGEGRVDIVYNVAGISGPSSEHDLETADWKAWDETMNIMVYGPWRRVQGDQHFQPVGAASTWLDGGVEPHDALGGD